VTGSPQAAQAVEWGMAKIESHGTGKRARGKSGRSPRLDARFRRTRTALAHRHRLTVDSIGLGRSTKSGGEEAEVIPVKPQSPGHEMKNAAHDGQVLVIVRRAPRQPDRKYGRFCQVR